MLFVYQKNISLSKKMLTFLVNLTIIGFASSINILGNNYDVTCNVTDP